MSLSRKCSRTACSQGAVATLTYDYAGQTAVVGPLATFAEPHTYDLCAAHAEGQTAPRGWDVVRLMTDYPEPEPSHDDLEALAHAVRAAGRPAQQPAHPPRVAPGQPAPGTPPVAAARESGRRGHLRVLRDS